MRRASDPTPLDVAAALLRRAPLSEAELTARLVAKGYRPETATTTVARCRELGYLGDAAFAEDRARALRRRGAGREKIAADLAGRGVPEPLVERAIADSLDGERESVWARRVLDRAGEGRGGPRAWRLLASRGFPEDVITELLGCADE